MAKIKSSSRGKRGRKKPEPTPQDKVVAAFLACGRCSFFLAGYRLIVDDFEQAVEKSEGNYLTLSWNHAVRQLVQKSYGSQIEVDAFHFQGSCKECRRSFTFQMGNSAEEPPTLEIAIKNR